MTFDTTQCASQSVGTANELFAALVQTILVAQCNISSSDRWPKDYGDSALEGLDDYDFIVVGAGSAGSVVAGRLSENENNKILLLEAGDDPPIESEIPLFFLALQNPTSAINWGYFAEKSNLACKAMKNGCYWPRGKMLGGSNGINGMIYVRGNDRDYDDWEKLGNNGWGWKDVLHYFKKSEGLQMEAIANVDNGTYHSTAGPLKVSSFHNEVPFHDVIIDASRELGYKVIADINRDEFVGVTRTPGTLDGNRRCTTAKSFLIPAKSRPNFHLIKNAHVTKVQVNDRREATGVEFVLNKRRFVVKAKKEVVLSAGSVNTPQILMLSGIGPREHLDLHGIDSIVDLPVGKHLQDHVDAIYVMAVNKGKSTPVGDAFLDTLYKYTRNEIGPSGLGPDLSGFFNTLNRTDRYPDIQTIYVYFGQGDNILLPKYIEEMLSVDGHFVNVIREANQKSDIVIALNILLKPKSLGKIELRSSDPFDAPRIHANYLTHDDDLKTLIRSLRLTQQFIETNVFRQHNVEAVPLRIPECDDEFQYDSDEFYECYVRYMSSSLYHPTGTAKMGPDSDREAVVDARLRVKGIKNLRVADASIMPEITSGNTNAPTVMIGEKAADMIEEDWR